MARHSLCYLSMEERTELARVVNTLFYLVAYKGPSLLIPELAARGCVDILFNNETQDEWFFTIADSATRYMVGGTSFEKLSPYTYTVEPYPGLMQIYGNVLVIELPKHLSSNRPTQTAFTFPQGINAGSVLSFLIQALIGMFLANGKPGYAITEIKDAPSQAPRAWRRGIRIHIPA